MNAPAKSAKGARVLDDKTTNPATGTPKVAESEVVAARKKNQNITIQYVDEKGAKHKGIPDDVVGVHLFIKDHIDSTIRFDEFPVSVQLKMMAFGANTVYRNQFNTRLNTEGTDVEEAFAALVNRHDNFLKGIWRPEGDGEGSATPLVIDAIKRAYLKAGKGEEAAQAAYDKSLASYRAADKDGKAALIKSWIKRGSVEVAFEEIKAERAAKRLADTKAKAKDAGQDDLADL